MWSASAVLLAIFSARSVVAASAASGKFNILSMNVAGLPAILNGNGEEGDKTTNTNLIGQVCPSCYHLPGDFSILTSYDRAWRRSATISSTFRR